MVACTIHAHAGSCAVHVCAETGFGGVSVEAVRHASRPFASADAFWSITTDLFPSCKRLLQDLDADVKEQVRAYVTPYHSHSCSKTSLSLYSLTHCVPCILWFAVRSVDALFSGLIDVLGVSLRAGARQVRGGGAGCGGQQRRVHSGVWSVAG